MGSGRVRPQRRSPPRGRLGARSDRTGCDTDPAAVTLLVRVGVQSFLLPSIGEHDVCGAAVDQSNVTGEDSDVDVVHSEVFEGARLSDVVEELGTVAGDARKLRDEVFGEELAEALDIVELVGVEEVLVERFSRTRAASVAVAAKLPEPRAALAISEACGDKNSDTPVRPRQCICSWRGHLAFSDHRVWQANVQELDEMRERADSARQGDRCPSKRSRSH